MRNRDTIAEPADSKKIRDHIFQQRLWIEQLKRTAADRETLRKAIIDLQALVIKASEAIPLRKHRRRAESRS